MTDWTIFYDDGSTYSSDDGPPERAPNKGVVCIADRKNELTIRNFDWYFWHATEGEWWGVDFWNDTSQEHAKNAVQRREGLIYQLTNDMDNHVRAVRQGAMVTEAFYQRCLARAFKARTE